MRITTKPRRRVRAAEDALEVEAPKTEVAPEATEILFETEDVAELLAEVTDSEVTVDVDDDGEQITFTVDETPYVVEPDGDEEILESSRRNIRGKRAVRASRAARSRRGSRRVR